MIHAPADQAKSTRNAAASTDLTAHRTVTNNAILDAIETAIGASPTLRIFTGAAPANVAASNTGTVVATVALPADWMQAASGGTKTMAGTWRDAEADAAGTAAHYRIFASDGTCHLQGTVTLVGGGGDMQLDNVSFQPGQEFSVVSYVWRSNNP